MVQPLQITSYAHTSVCSFVHVRPFEKVSSLNTYRSLEHLLKGSDCCRSGMVEEDECQGYGLEVDIWACGVNKALIKHLEV